MVRDLTLRLVAIFFAVSLAMFGFAGEVTVGSVSSESRMGNRESYPLPTATTFAEGQGLCGLPSASANDVKITDAGYRWKRLDLDWHTVEPVANGTYYWHYFDPLINRVIAAGLRPMMILHTSQDKYGTGAVDTP
jgi:hypothetical protein